MTIITNNSSVVAIEAHSPLSARLLSSIEVSGYKFTALWSSSLADSAMLCLPDTEAVSVSQRLNNAHLMKQESMLPIIMDCDTGDSTENLLVNLRKMSGIVDFCVIEDKKGFKKNSLLGEVEGQEQEDVEVFSKKIKAATTYSKKLNNPIKIVARIESFILNKGINDAIFRAKKYTKNGADGILIHSRLHDGEEIKNFLKAYRKLDKNTIIIVVPTTYEEVTFEELFDLGANIVVYANQTLRSYVSAVISSGSSILESKTSKNISKNIITSSEIINMFN